MGTPNWKTVALVLGGVLLALIVLCGFVYVQNVKTQAKLDAFITVQNSRITQADENLVNREKETKKVIQQRQDAASKITTPEQALQVMPEVVDLPEPIHPDPLQVGSSSPDFVLPYASVVPLYQQLETCKQTGFLLTSCVADKRDMTEKIDALTKERDVLNNARKGGSFWQKLGRTLKVTACAGGGAGAGGFAAGTKGAMVGAGAGAIVCSLF